MSKWCGPPHEPQYLCGAYARTTGKPCKRFAGENGRCKLHGGYSAGAKKPKVKHGRYTKEVIEQRKQFTDLLLFTKQLMKEINS
tara:strand:+ start:175530 stop:175781 length:252 start_codon:yes stop_codon:yes gene_type:complete